MKPPGKIFIPVVVTDKTGIKLEGGFVPKEKGNLLNKVIGQPAAF
jgi:hypothetical protein